VAIRTVPSTRLGFKTLCTFCMHSRRNPSGELRHLNRKLRLYEPASSWPANTTLAWAVQAKDGHHEQKRH
jgi:hypothetical protein